MKFAKRLASEASRRGYLSAAYFDYRAAKKAIKDDIQKSDVGGSHFQKLLEAELRKVSQFYSETADRIEANLKALHGSHAGSVQQLTTLSSEIKELIKFVALNYLAVVKAIKKRNRHLKESFGSAASISLQALDMLGQEVFFTSPRLASLATQADVLVSGLASTSQPSDVLEEYQCPICLDTLHNPVVLTCAHRFCWGCLVAHVTSVRDQQLPLTAAATDGKASSSSSNISNSLRLLERIVAQDDPEQQRFYNCPVCRKPQLLDVDSLSVDPFLSSFIESLKVLSVNGSAAVPAPAPAKPLLAPIAALPPAPKLRPAQPQPQPQPTWGIIPPQQPEHAGKLCVLLDLDGTLVSSYTPRRAPRLPHYVRTHVVGTGSKLNPAGVFVVERPGLREFLAELGAFAEVIIFTAGLEDYAKPIIDAIDPAGNLFAHRVYREGTLRTDSYQCVKDMARLNRDLRRTVLVDDTPLAFLHQPDNGVPVLGFRGDPDDRLLLEAVLPLMQVLAKESDVRSVLQRRFDMTTWFRRNSFPIDAIVEQAREAARCEQLQQLGGAAPCAPACSPTRASSAPAAGPHGSKSTELPAGASCAPRYTFSGPRMSVPIKRFAILTDFDKTLTDCDAGEAVVEQLAPELLPMLVGLEPAESYLPITNTILSEIQRRGVSRDQLLTTLQQLGAEMPLASAELLRMMHGAGIDVKILSDCNSVFIGHILAGAKVAGYVDDVITNPAAFERVVTDEPSSTGAAGGSQQQGALQRSAGHRLVIRPQFSAPQDVQVHLPPGHSAAQGGCAAGHCCARCPANMCKGLEVARLQHQNAYAHIVYCGDGANDVCGVLALSAKDVVLARAGHPLARYIEETQANPALPAVAAQVALWSTHEELLACVRQIVDV